MLHPLREEALREIRPFLQFGHPGAKRLQFGDRFVPLPGSPLQPPGPGLALGDPHRQDDRENPPEQHD